MSVLFKNWHCPSFPMKDMWFSEVWTISQIFLRRPDLVSPPWLASRRVKLGHCTRCPKKNERIRPSKTEAVCNIYHISIIYPFFWMFFKSYFGTFFSPDQSIQLGVKLMLACPRFFYENSNSCHPRGRFKKKVSESCNCCRPGLPVFMQNHTMVECPPISSSEWFSHWTAAQNSFSTLIGPGSQSHENYADHLNCVGFRKKRNKYQRHLAKVAKTFRESLFLMMIMVAIVFKNLIACQYRCHCACESCVIIFVVNIVSRHGSDGNHCKQW